MKNQIALIILVVFFVLVASVRADFIEVRRSAHVRMDPDSASASIINLQPPIQLHLLQDQQENGYYLVELDSGDEGWIYRTLVRRFPGIMPDLVADPEGSLAFQQSESDRFQIPRDPPVSVNGVQVAPDLVVGSWNIKWFGQRDPSEYDFVTMADFVEECDVVAIQEVRGSYDRACLNALIKELNGRDRNFRFRMSDRTGYFQNPDPRKRTYTESFAFIWDSDRLRLKGAPVLADSPAINHPVFRQVPYMADFEVIQGHGFDFRILTTHTVYNATINYVRRDEIEWISGWMLDTQADGEQDLIAIGDFNANPPSQTSAHFFEEIVPDDADFRVLMYESEGAGEESIRTTTPTLDYSPNPLYRNYPVYDHILVSHAASVALPVDPMTRSADAMGIYRFDDDPWWDEHGWTRREVISAVSDHRPIWFKFEYLADDLD